MSTLTRSQCEAAAQRFFQANPKQFEKYFSNSLVRSVVDTMSLPSVTAAKIAFDRLASNGSFNGPTAKISRAIELKWSRAPPLTRSELELFGSLSNRDLADGYWANDGYNEFKKCRRWSGT